MNVAHAVELADDVVSIVEQLKTEIEAGRPKREVYQDLFTLRRSVEQLEWEVRDVDLDMLGDAC